jgi:hypothetical protein
VSPPSLLDSLLSDSLKVAQRQGALVALRGALAIIERAGTLERAAEDIGKLIDLLERTTKEET